MRQRKSQPAGVLTHSCRWTRVSSTQLYWLSTDTDKSEKTLRRRDAWSIEYTKTYFMWYVHYSSFNLKLFFLYSHLILDVMTGKEGINTHIHVHTYTRDRTSKWQLPSQVNFLRKHLERLLTLPPFVFVGLVHSFNFQSSVLEFIFVFEVRIVHSLSSSCCLAAL